MGFWSFMFDKEENKEKRFYESRYKGIKSLAYGNNGEELTEDQVLSIPTAKACRDIIVGALKELPVKLYKKDFASGDYIEVKNDYRLDLLNREPNKFTTATEFKEQFFNDLILHGNAYIEIVQNDNKIDELWNLQSEYVMPVTYSNHMNKHRITDVEYRLMFNGENSLLTFDEVIACVMNSSDGLVGKGVIFYGNDIFKLALNEIELSKNIMENGSAPAGILKFPTRLDDESAKDIRESWKELYNGSKNRGKTIILEEGVEYESVTLTPTELGLTTSRTTTGGEICRLFSIPEALVDSTKANVSVEAVNIRYLQNCISPLTTPAENALSKWLLSDSEKKLGYKFVIDTSDVIKTTLAEKYNAYKTGIDAGILDINEVRRKEGNLPFKKRIQKLSLGDVLHFVDDSIIFNPNTSTSYNLLTGELRDPNKEIEELKGNIPVVDKTVKDAPESELGVESNE